MSKIVFTKEPDVIYDGKFSQIGANQVRLVFTDAVPDDDILLSGFNLINEHNGRIQTKRTDYIYIYRTYEDISNQIELCNDNNPWVEPEIVVQFNAGFGGALEGETKQIVERYEELVIPIPIPNENYRFVNWSPEIPISGIVEKNISFAAQFVYVPTAEELEAAFEQNKQNKINESKMILASYLEANPITSTAHGGKEGLYSVTSEKQSLMMSQYMTYQIEKQVNPDAMLTWNEVGKSCEIWTEEEFLQLVLEIKTYVYPLVSYQQTLEEHINACTTEEELATIVIDYSIV